MTDPTDFSFPEPLDDPLAGARDAVTGLAAALGTVGLKYVELPDTGFSANLMVPFGADGYVLVTVLQGNDTTVYLTSGAAADLEHDRLGALEFTNTRTRENPALPVFVHDADDAWDLLVQQSHPVALMASNPAFLQAMVHANIARVKGVHDALESTTLGGRPYETEAADLERLGRRSVS